MADEFEKYRQPPTDEPTDEFEKYRQAPSPEGVSLAERMVVKALGTDSDRSRKFLEGKPGEGGKPLGTLRWYDPANVAFPGLLTRPGHKSWWLRPLWGAGSKPGETDAELKGFFPGESFKQYETAVDASGEISVRPKGSQAPMVPVDPPTGALSKDIVGDVLDITPELSTLAFRATGPVGTGIQIAGLEATRRKLGEAYGLAPESGAETADAAALTGILGGLTQKVAGVAADKIRRGAGALMRGARNIPRYFKAKADVGEAASLLGAEQGGAAAKQAALRGERAALVRYGAETAEKAQPPIAKEAQALADLRKAQLRAEDDLLRRRGAVGADIEKGKEVAEKIAVGKAPAPPKAPKADPSPASAGIVTPTEHVRSSLLVEVLDPAYGVTAKHLRKLPELERIFGKHIPQLVPALGSRDMGVRNQILQAFERKVGAGKARETFQALNADVARWMLGSKRFAKLSEEARRAIAKVAKGQGDKAAQEIQRDALVGVIQKGSVPKYLQKAKRAFKEAQAGATQARADRVQAAIHLRRGRVDVAEQAGKLIPEQLSHAERAADIGRWRYLLGMGQPAESIPIPGLAPQTLRTTAEGLNWIRALRGVGRRYATAPPEIRASVERAPESLRRLLAPKRPPASGRPQRASRVLPYMVGSSLAE